MRLNEEIQELLNMHSSKLLHCWVSVQIFRDDDKFIEKEKIPYTL